MEKSVEGKKRVCVTGAGGFIASWLVKLLLSKDFLVNGTVRDPKKYETNASGFTQNGCRELQIWILQDYRTNSLRLQCDKKNAHLKKLDKASENLHLFKADLLDYDSVAAAIAGCEGVFHVASPVPSSKVPNPEVELIGPAVTGTLNVLKACSEAKIKRVVVVSSVAAVSMTSNWPQGKVMDEDCWSDTEYCKTTENWYCVSKTMAEKEALIYAEKHGLDIVTVCPSTVLGPLLQSTVNSSSLFLLKILTGKHESMENKIMHFVDVRDVADALILAYEKPEASGRYVCAPHPIKVCDFIDLLKSIYPNYHYPKQYTVVDNQAICSSEKLKKLGWKCRDLKETLVDTVESHKEAGLLNGK